MYFTISKKTQYAVFALVELGLRDGRTPVNARKMAQENDLPVRFLEVIINELKQGNFVTSIRGKSGGYVLARPAKEITLGQVLEFVESRVSITENATETTISGKITLDCLLEQANAAIRGIFEQCSLEDMVQREMEHRSAFETNYVI